MVEGKKKSRTMRRVKRKLPGNTVTVHYKLRKPRVGSCPVTGETLKGVPRERPSRMKNMPKTRKRPERPYGGVLSSKAMRETMRKRARSLNL